MMGLAVILAGKGFHSLQEAGVVPVSVLPVSVRIDLLGIYPSYQTIALQIGVIVLFAVLLFSDRNSTN
jgi:high-affinity iron transporter